MNKFELLALLIIVAPLAASILVGLGTQYINFRLAQILTSVSVIISTICSVILFNHIVFDHHIIDLRLFNWVNVGDFRADFAIYIDSLTEIMLIVVTSISSLVHIYSIGYMSEDDHKPRFMAYLSLFTFCMLMLVTSNNLLQLFMGWEGVGLSSYLLIGFWFKKESANNAAMKAFIVNRVGDLGFAIGIFLTFITFKSVEFKHIFYNAENFTNNFFNFYGVSINSVTAICLFLFIGCMGKSAQIGLHTWLPDAMEGPTPVSALIHAATMVTAGVFFTARLSPLFELSEVALNVVTIVGAVTCVFAATIALFQDDIKKIIAYSTCSQLGYMFFASGVSAYSAGVFHLMTHAFFKALLFLGAGSVIHAMNGEQDVKKMGGLARLIPFTFVMMWIGSLALAGIYPFAGFYSKDIILESAYASNMNFGKWAYGAGILAATMTAFYSWRLLILTFNGKPVGDVSHVHESPLTMTIPLFLLAIGAVSAGYIGNNILNVTELEFWNGAIMMKHNIVKQAHDVPQWVKHLPMMAAIVGIFVAYIFYTMVPKFSRIIYNKNYTIHKFIIKKWYFDELYQKLFTNSIKKLGIFLSSIIDSKIIDGIPIGLAYLTRSSAQKIRFIQSGYIYNHSLIILIGLVSLIIYVNFN